MSTHFTRIAIALSFPHPDFENLPRLTSRSPLLTTNCDLDRTALFFAQ
ncbi:hypothetical protein [Pseudanabaena minima]